MRFKYLSCITLFLSTAAFAQTTVKFKPGPATGEDVVLVTTYNCTLNGYSAPTEQLNNHLDVNIVYGDWSFSALGCSRGTERGLIRFSGLSTIPANAVILSAQLNLFGVSSSTWFPNSTYPGSPYGTTNEGWFRRVTGSWAQNTVTWNSQPTTTTTNQVAIQASASQWNWNVSLNVTQLVTDLRSSGQNNGFMFSLQNEQMYRHVEFASSNHSDTTLWPELVVTYQVPQSVAGIGGEIDPLIIYPNPASSRVSMKMPEYMHGQTTVTIADMTGRKLIGQQISVYGKALELDITSLPKGVYLIRAENSLGIASSKLTVQ